MDDRVNLVIVMAIRNRIAFFLEDKGISAYKLQKDTGISNTTVYSLKNNPEQYILGDVLDKLCAYSGEQPGYFLEHVSDEELQADS